MMQKEQVFDCYIVGNPNNCLRDKDLSLRAKGLLLIIADVESEVFTLRDLVEIGNCGKRAVISTLKELNEHHYLKLIDGDGNEV